MAGWHHRLDGHEFELTPGDGEGQGSLACCSPWIAKTQTRPSHANSALDFGEKKQTGLGKEVT